ncbi:hypothetical protein [Rubricoccus marinus]|uniref:hypothetical protein n=1 Tax=Rubricoccus marinus TaxID=716817 RepID=UPI00117AAFB0|nr:hypothetical protein [Rubricoccus marinus]
MRLVVFSLVFLLAGCTAWRPVPRASVGGPTSGPETVRLLLLDGRQLYIKKASTVGDSLIGRVENARVAFALTDIRRVDTQQPSAGKTRTATGVASGAAVGVGIAAALLALVALAAASLLDGIYGGS